MFQYEENQEFECPKCGKKFEFNESDRYGLYLNGDSIAIMSRDCHGIPFRNICLDCYDELDGYYDGEYYTEWDECIDDYY